MKVTHTHHLLPRHMGGTDEESNLVHGLSITRHVMYHFANWQLWGSKWDYIAWKTLAGQLSNEEFIFEMNSAAGKKGSAVTNKRYREEKKIWCAKSGRNQPREVKVHKRASISNRKPVKITRISSGESLIFESVKAAAKFIGATPGNLSRVACGYNRQVKGFFVEKI